MIHPRTDQDEVDRLVNLERLHRKTHKATRGIQSRLRALNIKILKSEKREQAKALPLFEGVPV